MNKSAGFIIGFMAISGLLAPGIAHGTYAVGDHVADFTLNDAYGNPVSLYDYQGMAIILNFWTST